MNKILLNLNELGITIDELKKEFIWWLIIEHKIFLYVENKIQRHIQHIQNSQLPRLTMHKITHPPEITYDNFQLFLDFIQELISKEAFSNEQNIINQPDFLNSLETSNFYINGKERFNNLNKFKNNSQDALVQLLQYLNGPNKKEVLLFGPFREIVQFEKYFKKIANNYTFTTELSVNKFKSKNINHYSFNINMVVAEKYLEQTGLVLFIWPMNGAGSSKKQDPGFYNQSGGGAGTTHRERTEQINKDKFRKLCSKLMKCYNDYELKERLVLNHIFQTSIALFNKYELIKNFESNRATFNFKVTNSLDVESVNDNIEFGIHLDKTIGKNRQFFVYNIDRNTIPIPPITTLEFFKLCDLTGVKVFKESELRDILRDIFSIGTKPEKMKFLNTNTNFIYQSLELFELFIFSNPAQNIVQSGGGSCTGRRSSRQPDTKTEEQEQETNILNDERYYRKLVPCFITRNETTKPTIILIPLDLLLNANKPFLSIYVREQTPIINFIFDNLDDFLKEEDNNDILNKIYETLQDSLKVSLQTIITGGKKNATKKSKKYIRTKLNSYTKNSLIKFNRKHKLKFKNLKKNELIDEIIRNLK